MDEIKRLLHFDRDDEACFLINRYVKEWDDKQLWELAVTILDQYSETVYMHLIRRRPDLINASGDSGMTALHRAAMYYPEKVQTLLALGADVNSPADRGEVPLDSAYRSSDMETIRILLQHGASTLVGELRFLYDTYEHYQMFAGRKLLRRAYYLCVLHKVSDIHSDHMRMVVEMLA